MCTRHNGTKGLIAVATVENGPVKRGFPTRGFPSSNMRDGEGCFSIGEGNIVPNRSIIVQVRIEDALSHCERSRQTGAKILTQPTELTSDRKRGIQIPA